MSTTSHERVRYPDSIDPVTTDGRDVDTDIASLDGEAAEQESKGEDQHWIEAAPPAWDRVPDVSGSDVTYYDRPLLKQSVWTADIPIYYFLGGTAGAALTLGAAIQLAAPRGRHPLRKISAICHWTGIIGSTAGAAFLVHDLGRPSRFLYMMRVFRPTSPMNMGVWILAGAAPTAITTGLLINRRGWPGKIGELSGYLSGLFGAALAGYTGVLVSTSAIPIWQQARRWLPVVFMSSSASAAAGVIDLVTEGAHSAALTRVFGTAARAVEIAATFQAERAAGVVRKVAEPLHQGRTGLMWQAATALTAVSLAVSLWSRRSRTRRIGGLLGIAGSLCLRFAVHSITNASARDPRASFQLQNRK